MHLNGERGKEKEMESTKEGLENIFNRGKGQTNAKYPRAKNSPRTTTSKDMPNIEDENRSNNKLLQKNLKAFYYSLAL